MDGGFVKLLLVILSAMVLLEGPAIVAEKTKLHILGLYPMTGGWAGGEALLPAAQLALKHINANDSILRDYEIVLHVGDTGVS